MALDRRRYQEGQLVEATSGAARAAAAAAAAECAAPAARRQKRRHGSDPAEESTVSFSTINSQRWPLENDSDPAEESTVVPVADFDSNWQAGMLDMFRNKRMTDVVIR
eukprot:SAG31_NODE_1540_length_7954_cov_3.521961_7_plen_108_part_00